MGEKRGRGYGKRAKKRRDNEEKIEKNMEKNKIQRE